jgi:hypothetical protein
MAVGPQFTRALPPAFERQPCTLALRPMTPVLNAGTGWVSEDPATQLPPRLATQILAMETRRQESISRIAFGDGQFLPQGE